MKPTSSLKYRCAIYHQGKHFLTAVSRPCYVYVIHWKKICVSACWLMIDTIAVMIMLIINMKSVILSLIVSSASSRHS